MIQGIAHVCFTDQDLDRSVAFYEALGCRHAFDFTRDSGERFGAYLHVGGRTFIELFIGDLADPAEGQRYRHMCLEVDDIHKTVEELRSRGLEVEDIKMGSDHSYQAWLSDPDGNRIELHHYTKESKQTPHLK